MNEQKLQKFGLNMQKCTAMRETRPQFHFKYFNFKNQDGHETFILLSRNTIYSLHENFKIHFSRKVFRKFRTDISTWYTEG